MAAQVHTRIGTTRYAMHLSTGTNTIVADEPVELGGGDFGFSPDQLLSASLGACTCATLRMYADRKGWPLEGAEVGVSFERDSASNTSHIVRSITLHGPLDEEQRQRLLVIANSCFIHRVLTHPIHISSVLSGPEAPDTDATT